MSHFVTWRMIRPFRRLVGLPWCWYNSGCRVGHVHHSASDTRAHCDAPNPATPEVDRLPEEGWDEGCLPAACPSRATSTATPSLPRAAPPGTGRATIRPHPSPQCGSPRSLAPGARCTPGGLPGSKRGTHAVAPARFTPRRVVGERCGQIENDTRRRRLQRVALPQRSNLPLTLRLRTSCTTVSGAHRRNSSVTGVVGCSEPPDDQ